MSNILSRLMTCLLIPTLAVMGPGVAFSSPERPMLRRLSAARIKSIDVQALSIPSNFSGQRVRTGPEIKVYRETGERSRFARKPVVTILMALGIIFGSARSFGQTNEFRKERLEHQLSAIDEKERKLVQELDHSLTKGQGWHDHSDNSITRFGQIAFYLSKQQRDVVIQEVNFWLDRWQRDTKPKERREISERFGIPLLRETQGSKAGQWGLVALGLLALTYCAYSWKAMGRDKAGRALRANSPDHLTFEMEPPNFGQRIVFAAFVGILALIVAANIRPTETLALETTTVAELMGGPLAETENGKGVFYNPIVAMSEGSGINFQAITDHEIRHLTGWLRIGPRNDFILAEAYAIARTLQQGGEARLQKLFIERALTSAKSAAHAAASFASYEAAFQVGRQMAHEIPDPKARDDAAFDSAQRMYGSVKIDKGDDYSRQIFGVNVVGSAWEATGGLNLPDKDRGDIVLDHLDSRTDKNIYGTPVKDLLTQRGITPKSASPNMFFYYLARLAGMPEPLAQELGRRGLWRLEIPAILIMAAAIPSAMARMPIVQGNEMFTVLMSLAATGLFLFVQTSFETLSARTIGERPSFWKKFAAFAPYLVVTWGAALQVSFLALALLMIGAALFHMGYDGLLTEYFPNAMHRSA